MEMILTMPPASLTDTETQSPPEESSWSICESCSELLLPVFIKCSITGDLSGLIKSGTPPEAELEAAWLKIHSEYTELIGGVHVSALIQKSRLANALASRIDRINTMVECAREIYHEGIIGQFRLDGFGVLAARLETDDDAAYNQTLDAILRKLRPDVIKLQTIAKEREKAQSKQKAHKTTEQDFGDMLFEISLYVKYEVRDDITVAKYCTYVRKLQEHIKHLSKLSKDGRRVNR